MNKNILWMDNILSAKNLSHYDLDMHLNNESWRLPDFEEQIQHLEEVDEE
jgi:hypothetical protein